MKITIEKGVCLKCNGFKFIYETNVIGYNRAKLTDLKCSLCQGEGLIVVKTVEEIEKPTKKK